MIDDPRPITLTRRARATVRAALHYWHEANPEGHIFRDAATELTDPEIEQLLKELQE